MLSRCGHGLKPSGLEERNLIPTHPGRRGSDGGFQAYGEYTRRMPFMDPFGGVAKQKIDGVAAEDLVASGKTQHNTALLQNVQRRGAGFMELGRLFLHAVLALYRKNYLAGSIVLFLSLVSSFINSFVMNNFIFPALDMSSESAMMESIFSLMRSGRHMSYFYIIFLLFVIRVLIMFIFGLAGNAVYKSTAIKRIKRIGEKTGISRIDNGTPIKHGYLITAELSAQGGVVCAVAIASGYSGLGRCSALFLSI